VPRRSRVRTFIGRKDSTNSAPAGGLADVLDIISNLFSLFAKKGFSAEGLAARLGTHSTVTQKYADYAQANQFQDWT
jgi:hypothetical protein